MWVAYDGCSPQPQTWTSPSGNITREWYGSGREGSEVVLYSIKDGGHSWPGGVPLSATGGRLQSRMAAKIGQPTQEISANDLMLEFFQRHAK